MRYTIITTTNARLDIQNAIDWENKRSPGLGMRFLEDIEEKLFGIAKSPYINSVRYESIRCGVTSVFSYLIHYTVDETQQQVIILRILHTSREPIW